MNIDRESDSVHTLLGPVPGHSVAVFRIVMGALLLFESVNYGLFHCLDCGYRNTALLFKYQYFDWVQLPPGRGLELLLFVMGVASLGVMLGLFYRVCVVIVTFCLAWFFLLDSALYLNHYYLTLLFLGILCFIPANRVWSLDARRHNYSPWIGNWSRVWLIVQLEIVLIYAGLVKINSDWLQLEPLRLWMTTASADAGPLMQWLTQDPGITLASFAVIALHVLGAPLLLFKKTRLPVFCAYLVFHTINALVFDIGIFPFMTAAATTLIFDPDWPLKLYSKIRGTAFTGFSTTAPSNWNIGSAKRVMILGFVGLWLTIQVVLPTRPLWYPGPASWNESGHYFSWRMKLRDKRGRITYTVRNLKTKKISIVDPKDYLTRLQVWKMVCHPDLIWQFAQYLGDDAIRSDSTQSLTRNDLSVIANTQCSLNTRPHQRFVQPINLLNVSRNAPREQWLEPLTTKLPSVKTALN